MAITDTYDRLPCTSIIVDRENRQRKVIDTKGLKESIAARGVLQPIIIKDDFTLVAGERRLTASLELGLPDIPVRYFADLSAEEAQIIELEENLKRTDLDWKDHIRAVAKIHELYLKQDPSWTLARTGQLIAFEGTWVGRIIKVAKNLDNPRLAGAQNLAAALNIISRYEERLMGDVLSDICETTAEVFGPKGALPTASESQTLPLLGERPSIPTKPLIGPQPKHVAGDKSPKSIPVVHADFIEWSNTYAGPKFNFIHCDFPYGIDFHKGGDLTGKNSTSLYDDSPDIYWELTAILCRNLDRLMAVSGHLMFWYSMHYHQETLDFFAKNAPSLVFNPFPLIWVKSDNVGLLPDPKRGPRRVYETCLFASREDRPIIKAISNAYSAPTDRQWHPSTKPEPVLRHFFQMFVDQTTKMLDPTCGSGSSLRAAESMGAEAILGFEKDQEHFEAATQAYKKFRILRGV